MKKSIITKEANDLQGKKIKYIFKEAYQLAKLHDALTSTKGQSFRLRLLQKVNGGLTRDKIEKIRGGAKLQELDRHINKLLKFKLIKKIKTEGYKRTKLGEEAVNSIRALERSMGNKDTFKIFKAALGKNSIRLFLIVYGQKKEPSIDGGVFKKKKKLVVRYKPLEIGRMIRFLPRTIEGVSAIDKLNLAGLLTYESDGYVHMHSIKGRGFYQYLKELYKIKEAALKC